MRMLEGKTVRLRAVERADMDVIAEHYNDRDVVSFVQFWDAPYGIHDARQIFERWIAEPALERPWAIETLPDGEFAGMLGVSVHWRPRVANLGIALWNPDTRGRGYGTEALELLLEHCFLTLNLNRVELEVWSYNARALRAYEKAGFVEEGRKRQAWFWDGTYHDAIIMSVLRDEWRASLS